MAITPPSLKGYPREVCPGAKYSRADIVKNRISPVREVNIDDEESQVYTHLCLRRHQIGCCQGDMDFFDQGGTGDDIGRQKDCGVCGADVSGT